MLYRIIFIILGFLSYCVSLKAQTDSLRFWHTSGKSSIQLNQAHFSNWAGGGHTAISLSGSLEYDAFYQKGKTGWINTYAQFYGISKLGKGTNFRKNHDIVELNSRVSFAHKKRTHFIAFTNVLTQVAKGFSGEAGDNSNHVSSLFSPGYITEGLGYEYRDENYKTDSLFFVVFAPIAGKQTIVLDNNVDGTLYGLKSSNGVRSEMGMFIQAGFKRKILERTFLSTDLQLYTNYLSEFGNIDVNWRTALAVHANKWITMQLMANLVYNDDTMVPQFADLNSDGFNEAVGVSRKLQLMQTLGLGVTIKLK